MVHEIVDLISAIATGFCQVHGKSSAECGAVMEAVDALSWILTGSAVGGAIGGKDGALAGGISGAALWWTLKHP